jgi:dolichol-phosphate mannosyltransferase
MEIPMKRIVVICPVYNEESNVGYFVERFQKVVAQVDPARYEVRLLFTNNRSSDGTLDKIKAEKARFGWIDYLTLSRNHGYQLSVLSGLTTVDADLYMVCDCDCEDPPEMLLAFLQRIEAGADVAYGIRTNRPDPALMLKCRLLFYRVLRALGDFRIVPYMAEFGLMRRCVRDVIVSGKNSFPFLRAEIGFAGFRLAGVDYRRESRHSGRSHYNLWGNFRFAVAGILASTTFPLRATFYVLPFAILANLFLLAASLASLVSFPTAALLFLCLNSCYVCFALAFISIYLARTYQNGLERPRFIIDRSLSSLPAIARDFSADSP